MQYSLLGVGSGFFAHVLATLMVCWRRMLRLGGAVALVTALAIEALGLTVTHQFPPSLATNLLAAALALALGYGVGATVFAAELVRGAVRALTLLQSHLAGQEAPAQGRTAEGFGSTALPTPLPAPLPTRASRPSEPPAAASIPVARRGEAGVYRPSAAAQRPFTASAPWVATSLPLSEWEAHPFEPGPMRLAGDPRTNPAHSPAYAARAATYARPQPSQATAPREPYRGVEQDATRAAAIYEEEGASVMLLPENSLYGPQFAGHRASTPVASSAALGPGVFVAPLEAPGGRGPLAASEPFIEPLPPLASAVPVSPPPDLYAPWSAVPALEPLATVGAPVSPTGRTELDPAMAGIVAGAAPADGQGPGGLRGRISWPRLARR